MTELSAGGATWAVFLDRDGTLNTELGYLDDPTRLRLLPGAAEAIRLLNECGTPAIVVSNQSGVGRGYFTDETVGAIHERLAEQLATASAHLDGIYYCPHHPSLGCDCRKPNPGMLLRAAAEHGIDLQRSFIIGDKSTDLEAGRRAGCRAIGVLTGYGHQLLHQAGSPGAPAEYLGRDVLDAVTWILAKCGRMTNKEMFIHARSR